MQTTDENRQWSSPSQEQSILLPTISQEVPAAPRKPKKDYLLDEKLQEYDDPLDDNVVALIDQLDITSTMDEENDDNEEMTHYLNSLVEDIKSQEAEEGMTANVAFDMAVMSRQRSEGERPHDELLNHYLFQIPRLKDQIMWSKYITAYYKYADVYNFPSWINPSYLKDVNGHPPEDPTFNFGRIWWPGPREGKKSARPSITKPTVVGGGNKPGFDDRMHFTPAMCQYWDIKSQAFSNILFFKLGKFYELFYTDAAIAQEILGLKWMGKDQKAHVGFPESSLCHYGKQLVDLGFTVSVVEQMETPDELSTRKQQGATQDNAVKRSVCEVYTRGTLTHEKMLGALPSYLVSLYYGGNTNNCSTNDGNTNNCSTNDGSTDDGQYGMAFVDVVCCHVQFAIIPSERDLRNVLGHLCPKEVILNKTTAKKSTIELIESFPCPPTIVQPASGAADSEQVGYDILKAYLLKCNNEDESIKILEWIANVPKEGFRAIEQLWLYLQDVLLAERIFTCGSFNAFEETKNHLVLDAVAIEALGLEDPIASSVTHQGASGAAGQGVVQQDLKTGELPSLFQCINRCATVMGQRQLRQWIHYPLLNIPQIEQRQRAVQFLIDRPSLVSEVGQMMRKLPDLERQFGRISGDLLKSERGAVYFSERSIGRRISSYVEFLKDLSVINDVINRIQVSLEDRGSDLVDTGRVAALVKETYNEALIMEVVRGSLVRIESVGGGTASKNEFRPKTGIWPDFDEKDSAVQKLKDKLESYLSKGAIWKTLGIGRCSGCYIHSKYRYEVEVSEQDWKKVQRAGGVMTSTRKGYVRFQEEVLQQMVNELINAETEAELTLHPWLSDEIRLLHQKNDAVIGTLKVVAELDCLMSMATYALELHTWCFPQFVDDDQHIFLDTCYHPIAMITNPRFIPNTVKIQGTKSIVLTGPNMGGKSTLSRQLALLILMAQMGLPIPAKEANLAIFDRIFTRVGLRDVLAESKSTFLIELEEVLEMLKHATHRSLLLIDEFGRGTNSKEGTILAASTLKYITHKINCITLFATHFPLHNWLCDHSCAAATERGHPCVTYQHLAANIHQDTVIFTYKLADGRFPESYGLQVASLAGIPSHILQQGMTDE
ncbi:putative DNA mismatch repair protein MutS [Gregarina niphandrodes]|uniref:DNA mismatch repair protein n=1 Tax=Gregarina niphandrodes TaxID=110365 RepID=A0A023B9E7_GRENI|nr:putative DNA mismatch repair protein MutS [Gregarina niphandrodes]EZG72706.1 putative DNA mismatch repair protein MutS [Gregarina niphandrodes]|eukprot:XP_011129764.1 putative DNA mismatch repair protein MutS [Gregarina niphandrodes]